MATPERYYEVIVPGWRTALRMLDADAVAYNLKHNHIVTPLVLATPERIEALNSLLVTIDHDAGLAQDIAVLRAMLADMKGATDE